MCASPNARERVDLRPLIGYFDDGLLVETSSIREAVNRIRTWHNLLFPAFELRRTGTTVVTRRLQWASSTRGRHAALARIRRQAPRWNEDMSIVLGDGKPRLARVVAWSEKGDLAILELRSSIATLLRFAVVAPAQRPGVILLDLPVNAGEKKKERLQRSVPTSNKPAASFSSTSSKRRKPGRTCNVSPPCPTLR